MKSKKVLDGFDKKRKKLISPKLYNKGNKAAVILRKKVTTECNDKGEKQGNNVYRSSNLTFLLIHGEVRNWGKWGTTGKVKNIRRCTNQNIPPDEQLSLWSDKKKKKVVWNVFVLKRAENENKEHSAIMDEEPDESAEMNFNWREVLQFFFPDLMQHPHNQVMA